MEVIFLNLKKWIIAGVAALLLLLIGVNSCSVIGPTERGIKVTLGVASENVLQPGLTIKAPFFQKVQKYDLTPIQY